MQQLEADKLRRITLQQMKNRERLQARTIPYTPPSNLEPRFICHPNDRQFFADQQWIYRQQHAWSSKFPTKLRLKLLAQLSTHTLRRFMKDDSIIPKLKRAIEMELHKRHHDSTMNPKSVSTALIKEFLLEVPHIHHLDAVSELFRRQRVQQHKSLCSYPDDQLELHLQRIQQHYHATANQHFTMLIQRQVQVASTAIESQHEAQLETDAAMQHASAIHTERQQVLAERKRRELELEAQHRKDDELKLQQRRDALKVKKETRALASKQGVARKSHKQKKTPEDEELIEDMIGTSLEKYDWLVHQLYNDPVSAEQYEIVNVYNDKATGSFMSTARPTIHTDLLEAAGEELFQTRMINGADGTLELVNLLSRGQRIKTDIVWPTEESKWLELQQEDNFCKPLLALLTTSTMK